MKIPTQNKLPKNNGLRPSMTIKNVKLKDYVYVLSNGQELTFKDKEFPIKKPLIENNGQLIMF